MNIKGAAFTVSEKSINIKIFLKDVFEHDNFKKKSRWQKSIHRGSYMRILHECSCFIEFMKRIEEKR